MGRHHNRGASVPRNVRMRWRQAVLGLTAVGAGLVVAAIGSPAAVAGQSPYQIGSLADLSGPISVYDKPVVAGMQTYFDALNAKGGVNHRKINLTNLDTKSYDIPTTRTDFQELQSKGVLAIEGPLLSTAYQAIGPLATRNKISLLSAGTPTNLVSSASKDPYFFLTAIPLPDEASIAVKKLASELGKSAKPRISALRTDSVDTDMWASALAKDTQKTFHTSLAGNLTLNTTSIDPSTQVAQIIAEKPTVVMLRILSSQVPLAVKELRQRGFTGQIISDYGGADTSVLKAVNDPKYLAIRDFQDVVGSNAPVVAKMNAQAKKYGQSGSATSSFFTYGYITGELIAQVLKKCGSSCTSSTFARTLSALKPFSSGGLSGPLGFAKGTHVLVNYGRLYAWSGGHLVAKSGWINGAS